MMPPIKNAKDMKLSETFSNLPDMSGPVSSFPQPLQWGKMIKTLVNGYVQEIVEWTSIQAVVQPLKAEALEMKPEGERAWKWYELYTLANVLMSTDDVVILHGIQYRIMDRSNLSEYGYMKYEVQEDYQHA
jgi:hypothetical protein